MPLGTGWKEAFRTYLLSQSDVAVLVDDRVQYGRRSQQDVGPGVVYRSMGTIVGNSLDSGPDGVPTVKLRLDCYAPTAEAADTLARTIRRPTASGGIDGFRGLMGGAGGVFVQALLFEEGGVDDYEPGKAGDSSGTHVVSMGALLSFEEL